MLLASDAKEILDARTGRMPDTAGRALNKRRLNWSEQGAEDSISHYWVTDSPTDRSFEEFGCEKRTGDILRHRWVTSLPRGLGLWLIFASSPIPKTVLPGG